MAKQLFKGFKQVLSGETFENGYIYFVREDDTMEHGYLYFNGKKYGTTKEMYDELVALKAISADTRLEALEALSAGTRLDALEDAVVTADTRLDALETAMATADTRLDAIEADYLKDKDKQELIGKIQEVANDLVKDVRYDTSAKTIYIEYNDGSVSTGFSAADFIVDGMLSSVTHDATAHTMTFIWNTDAGGKEITIDLDDVIAPYSGDEKTVHLGENNTFSAIMDQENGVASHSALLAEASARTAADKALNDAISAETAAREAAIQAEASARTAADEALSEAISSETAARKAAIEALDATVSGADHDVVVTVTETNGVITDVTVSAPDAITALTVNGQTATVSEHGAEVDVDATNIAVGAGIPDAPSAITSASTVSETLADIYAQLASVAEKVDITSPDSSITINKTAEDFTIKLNREEATDATVAAGHIEIKQNASGETYAQMYYDGNDA